MGIMMNRAEQGEHHCVLVYDPTVIDEEDLLTQPPPTPTRPAHGWVLDAWERGEPDIYPLHEWRKVNTPIRREWELQDLTTYTTWDPSRARAQVRKVPDPEDAPLTDGTNVTPANSSVPPMQKVWMR